MLGFVVKVNPFILWLETRAQWLASGAPMLEPAHWIFSPWVFPGLNMASFLWLVERPQVEAGASSGLRLQSSESQASLFLIHHGF